MDCYYHHEVNAVGICKNCHKGICAECAGDTGNGLACRGECEQAVQYLNAYVQKNIDMMTRVGPLQSFYARMYRFIGAGLGAIGAMLMALGMSRPRGDLVLLSSLLLVFGIVIFMLGTKMKTAFRTEK
jgi:hypothetical protein